MGNAALKLEPLDLHLRRSERGAPRATAHVAIDIQSEHNFWSGLTMNMSEGGVFVATYHVVPVGTLLAVQLQLPFRDEPIVALAEVRWTRGYSGQDDVPPGLGLQFVDVDEASLVAIRRFVETVREPLFYDD